MIKIVVGANYGDEGKGLCCNELTKKAISEDKTVLNVLFNGGPQRAHTVESRWYGKHIFHHFGSGTLNGAVTLMTSDFLINPMIYVQESRELKNLMHKDIYTYASDMCRLITPYDMMANQIIELNRSKQDKHGTCGQGIWTTIRRFETFSKSLTVGQFVSANKYVTLQRVKKYYEEELHLDIPAEYAQPWNSASLVTHYIDDFEEMRKTMILCDEHSILTRFYLTFGDIIFEAGQGLALDWDEDLIYATPSYTGSKHIIKQIKKDFAQAEIEVWYVTRTYFTRHGAGPLPTEVSSIDIKDSTNIFNQWQEGIRYGAFSVNEMMDRIEKDKTEGIARNLLITHMNNAPDTFNTDELKPYFKSVYTSDNRYDSQITKE